MENSILNCAIRNVFASRADLFGQDFVLKYFETEPNDSAGVGPDGFNSNLIFGRIVYTDKQHKTTHKSKPVLIKLMPEIPNSRFLSFAFINEIHFYSRLLPFFATFDNSANDLFPKFLSGELSYSKGLEEGAIILEDLRCAGYRMTDKKSYLDYPHLALMCRKLGEFHAYSFEARHRSPHLFHALATSFLETYFAVTKEVPNFLTQVGERGLLALHEDPVYSSKVADVKTLLRDADAFVKEVLTADKESSIAVLCHGDFLRNNVMFRYEEEEEQQGNGSTPNDMKFIDMATCRLASPVVDLATVLYLNADQKTRNQYWPRLLNEYYTALRNTFPENPLVPPKQQIFDDFQRKAFFGYLVASYFLPFLIAEDSHLPDILEPLPEEMRKCGFHQIPIDCLVNINLIVAGTSGTESLVNILKDMINRGFI